MSDKKEQKTIKITENNLVDLIDNIVTEAVAKNKVKWLAEQAKDDKSSLLEGRITKLENILRKATITKKAKKVKK